MLERYTTVDQIEITRSGIIQVRFGKQIRETETGEVVSQEWHRTVLEPGADLDVQLAAVNAHLQSLAWAECSDQELALLRQLVPLVHTPERTARHRARVALEART